MYSAIILGLGSLLIIAIIIYMLAKKKENFCNCQPTEYCKNDSCFPKCGGVMCSDHQYCDQVNNVCQDICGDAICANDEICVNQLCVSKCNNVVCGDNKECSNGKCVDLCGGVYICSDKESCQDGYCV